MTKEEIQKRYKEYIIPESKNSFHFFKPQTYDLDLLAYNPLCGDKYHLYPSKEKKSVHFHGIGCALSQASASLLARSVDGLNLKDQQSLIVSFLSSLELNQAISIELPYALQVLASLKHFEGRIDCIKLPWQTLLDGTH